MTEAQIKLLADLRSGAVRLVPGEATAWNYDLDKQPNGMHEVAFDGGIGMCNVRICRRVGRGPTLINGRPVPVDHREFFYEEERGDGFREIPRSGWRPYAWRQIAVPDRDPTASTFAASPDLSASLAEMIEGLVEQVEYWPETSKHWEARALASEARVSELQAENEKLMAALEPFAGCIFNDNGDITVNFRSFTPDELIAAYFAHKRARALAKDHPNGQG